MIKTPTNAKNTHDLLTIIASSVSSNARRPIDYLEIGVREGDSMKVMLENENIRIAVGVDTWGSDAGGTGRGSPDHIPSILGEGMDRVILITGSSHDILPGLRHLFDMIYIDGDHSEAGAVLDLTDCLRLLKPDGVIVADDADHPLHSYLRGVIQKWAEANGLALAFHGCGYGVAEMRRKP